MQSCEDEVCLNHKKANEVYRNSERLCRTTLGYVYYLFTYCIYLYVHITVVEYYSFYSATKLGSKGFFFSYRVIFFLNNITTS